MAIYGCLRLNESIRRQKQILAEEKTPWTSARCLRLLRPLSSKIAYLRKESHSESQKYEQAIRLSSGGSINVDHLSAVSVDIAKHERHAEPVSCSGEVEEWDSNTRPRKRIKRTYSSRTRCVFPQESGFPQDQSRPIKYLEANCIELPNHLLNKRAQAEPSSADETFVRRLPSSRLDIDYSHVLPKNAVQQNWKLLDSICYAFAALLKATYSRRPSHEKGSDSLLATCLRQTPQYIAEEDNLSKIEDPDSEEDTSSRVYNDLEEFGTMAGAGWEPLRLVVRAHGTKMITDAIQEGLLGISVARHLYYVCHDLFASDEGEQILESLSISTDYAPALLSTAGTTTPEDIQVIVSSLENMASKYGRKNFLFRHTTNLLENGILGTDWISSQPMIRTWNRVIQSISQEDEDAESAVLLLRTAVSYCSTMSWSLQNTHQLRVHVYKAKRRPTLRSSKNVSATESIPGIKTQAEDTYKSQTNSSRSETKSTLQNVLTMITAIARLQDSSTPDSTKSCTLTSTTLQYLAMDARRAVELFSHETIFRRAVEQDVDSLYLPLLAASEIELPSVQSDAGQLPSDLPSLKAMADLSAEKGVFKGAGAFLCAVGRCRGRVKSDDPFNVIRTLVNEFRTVSKSIWSERPMKALCNEVAIAAAFTYAEDTSRPAHLDWALQLEREITGKVPSTPRPVMMKTPVRISAQRRECFRWEEGICEWIVKTPALLQPKPLDVHVDSDPVDHTHSADNDFLQPLRNILSRKVSSTDSNEQAKDQNHSQTGTAKAIHVLVHQTGNHSNIHNAETPSITNTHADKLMSAPKPAVRIQQDDDLDELSAIELSQEVSSALRSLRKPPNLAPGTKRKRQIQRPQNSKALRCKGEKQDLVLPDADELADFCKLS